MLGIFYRVDDLFFANTLSENKFFLVVAYILVKIKKIQ